MCHLFDIWPNIAQVSNSIEFFAAVKISTEFVTVMLYSTEYITCEKSDQISHTYIRRKYHM